MVIVALVSESHRTLSSFGIIIRGICSFAEKNGGKQAEVGWCH